MDFLTLAKNRYSCRSLTGGRITDENIDKIIEAGMAAPTAVNKFPVKIFVLNGSDAVQNMKSVTSCTFGAETFFVVGYREDEGWVREFDGRRFADIDAGIVATHMMLEIEDLGLGTTWVGWFDAPKLRKIYPDMKDYELVAVFPVGKPSADAAPSPRHSARRDRSETVEFL